MNASESAVKRCLVGELLPGQLVCWNYLPLRSLSEFRWDEVVAVHYNPKISPAVRVSVIDGDPYYNGARRVYMCSPRTEVDIKVP